MILYEMNGFCQVINPLSRRTGTVSPNQREWTVPDSPVPLVG
jgi:hypothetical protein